MYGPLDHQTYKILLSIRNIVIFPHKKIFFQLKNLCLFLFFCCNAAKSYSDAENGLEGPLEFNIFLPKFRRVIFTYKGSFLVKSIQKIKTFDFLWVSLSYILMIKITREFFGDLIHLNQYLYTNCAERVLKTGNLDIDVPYYFTVRN